MAVLGVDAQAVAESLAVAPPGLGDLAFEVVEDRHVCPRRSAHPGNLSPPTTSDGRRRRTRRACVRSARRGCCAPRAGNTRSRSPRALTARPGAGTAPRRRSAASARAGRTRPMPRPRSPSACQQAQLSGCQPRRCAPELPQCPATFLKVRRLCIMYGRDWSVGACGAATAGSAARWLCFQTGYNFQRLRATSATRGPKREEDRSSATGGGAALPTRHH